MQEFYKTRVRNLIKNLSVEDNLEYTTYLVEELTSALNEIDKIKKRKLRKEIKK